MRWFFLLFSLIACTPAADTGGAGDSGGPTDTAATDPAVDWPERSDEEVVRALIDGTGPPLRVALQQVAWGGGFPVHTEADTWLFLVESNGSVSWNLAGDHNAWSPAAMREAEGFAWVEVAIPAAAGKRYKFTHDDVWAADRWARAYEYDDEGEISFVAPPTTRSRIDRWPDLRSQELLPRDLRVLVPPGAGPWPVLYAQDGQNLFDPGAFWGGWHLQDAVADLDRAILVVGIDSTADRFDEYTQVPDVIDGWATGGSAADYARLLQQDVRPFVEAEYGSTGLDGLLGSSLGGLASLFVAAEYPGAFDFVASMSGTLGWGRFGASNRTMQEIYEDAGVGSAVLYVDSGGDDGGNGCTDPDRDGFPEDDLDDFDNYCTNRQFADAMADLGYAWNVDLYHWHEDGAPHNELAWSRRVHLPLEHFADLAR